MAKRRLADRKQPLFSHLDRSPSDPPEMSMGLDESETLLDSSTSSFLNTLEFQAPSSVLRDTSLASINTQSTNLTMTGSNSKLISPAVTVVDIDLKTHSIEEFHEVPQTSTRHPRRSRHRRSYDGLTDEMPMRCVGGALKGTVLMAIESNQNIIRDTMEPQTSSGESNCL